MTPYLLCASAFAADTDSMMSITAVRRNDFFMMGWPVLSLLSVSEQSIDFLRDFRFRGSAYEFVDKFPVLEEKESRDVADAESHRYLLAFVNIAFGDDCLALVFPGKFFHHRGDCPARTAPCGPEVYHHRFVSIQDLLKIGVSDFHFHDI